MNMKCTNAKEEKMTEEEKPDETKTKDDIQKIGESTDKMVKKEDPRLMEENTEETSKKQPYKCSRCKKSYTTENEFNSHMEKQHTKLPTDEKDALKLTSELSALLDTITDINRDKLTEEKPVSKDDLNQTVKETQEEWPQRPKRKVKDNERIYECDICKFQTTDFGEHNKHRVYKHKLGKITLPSNGAPIQIKRKLITLNTVKYQCEKCNFETKNKTYLPQHMKKIHGKVSKTTETTNNKLIRTSSANSTSSIPSPPNKTRKVTTIGTSTTKIKLHNKESKDEQSEDVTEKDVELCYQKLLRGKSIKEAATNTEREIENAKTHNLADLEKEVKEHEQSLIGASEVIQNLEEENNDLHKKVNYLGNNADLVEDLLREIKKFKKQSMENNQSCMLCDEADITMYELRYHIKKIHSVEEDLDNEEDEILREWLKQLRDMDDQKDKEEEDIQQELKKMKHEILELRDAVQNKDMGLQKYEEIVKKAKTKYNEDEKQIKVLKKENEELQSNVRLLKKAVKVTESKNKSKEGENQEEEMEQDESYMQASQLIQSKSEGFFRCSPQLNSEIRSHQSFPAFTRPDVEPGKTYTCHICKQGGITELAVEAHMKSHREEGDLKCDDCSFQANNIDVLKNHTKIVKHTYTVKVQDFICDKCGIECETMNELRDHKKRHDAKHVMKCRICDQEFTSNGQLRNHMREAHRILREDWSQIQTGNSSLEERTNHILHNVNIKCNFCEVKFNNRSDMWHHRKEHHSSHKPCRNFPNCEYAGRCVYSHNMIPEGKVRCFECGNEFDTQKALMLHRKNVHMDKTPCRQFQRNKCDRSNEECWYSHNISQINQSTDFQIPIQNQAPPGNHPLNQTSQVLNQTYMQQSNQLKSLIPEILSQMMPHILQKIMEKIK